MDEVWALAQLDAFISMTALRQASAPPGVALMGDYGVPRGGGDAIAEAAYVVEQIIPRVLPGWSRPPDRVKDRWQTLRGEAIRARAQLMRAQELADKLGDASPVIRAGQLHPWVWEAAKSLWQTAHYGEAVNAVGRKINAEAQTKVGRRDISETDLFKQVFSSDAPRPGAPRLRPRGDDGGKSAVSIRRGVSAFAEGCYAAIRNPLSHEDGVDLSEQEALEQLAALSLLARWVDESTVHTSYG